MGGFTLSSVGSLEPCFFRESLFIDLSEIVKLLDLALVQFHPFASEDNTNKYWTHNYNITFLVMSWKTMKM